MSWGWRVFDCAALVDNVITSYSIHYTKLYDNKDKQGQQGSSGDANLNSVILGAGSKVKGDIIIIDQSKGPKTNVATD